MLVLQARFAIDELLGLPEQRFLIEFHQHGAPSISVR
jgi:hypothetical protein